MILSISMCTRKSYWILKSLNVLLSIIFLKLLTHK